MRFLSIVSSLTLGSALVFVGCASEPSSSSPEDAAEQDEPASEEELRTNAQRLAGAYQQNGEGSIQPPRFRGLVLRNNGTFFADIDTGKRCASPSCNPWVKLEGTFLATKSLLTLSAKSGAAAHEFHGRYRYTVAGANVTITRRDFPEWKNGLVKARSYCMDVSDCDGQTSSGARPACVGAWTCGGDAENTCVYECRH